MPTETLARDAILTRAVAFCCGVMLGAVIVRAVFWLVP